MPGVPFFDLKLQYKSIKSEIDEAVQRVFESQQFILGPEVAAFEEEVAHYCGCRHAIAVSSGTDALLVALMALEIKPGDEVITTPFTFFATAGSIARLGAIPIFVDIDPVTLDIDVQKLEAAVTAKTKAIMPVHLFGQCADMDEIRDIAARHNLAVIEDAAQAIGATYKGVKAGALGTYGCFSFFPTKNLGACGEGGLVTANDSALADRIKLLRAHGARKEYFHEEVGGNFRIHGIQGAVLRVKLRHLDEWTAKRRANSDRYRTRFRDAGVLYDSPSEPVPDGLITIPVELPDRGHAYLQYVIRVKERDGLIEWLGKEGVGTKIYYPRSLHQQACFESILRAGTDCSVSERVSNEVLALPIFPELTPEQIDFAADAIIRFLRR